MSPNFSSVPEWLTLAAGPNQRLSLLPSLLRLTLPGGEPSQPPQQPAK